MDYLDPRKRRAHRHRLAIGYALMTIVILLGAIILVYTANGYGINTKTGSIVQNGLLFVDSKPSGADIYLNGQNHGSHTSARLILPAGNYTLDLKRSGYRDWQRSFVLTEHSIARYIYPFLFPVKLNPQALKNYSDQPQLITQSPDYHWLLVQSPADSMSFDEYDTTDLKSPAKSVDFPNGLVSSPISSSSPLQIVEWSTDNKNLLVEHETPDGSEFIVLNRASPQDSFNVNKKLGVSPTEVALRNKKVDQLYLYDAKTDTLQLGDVSAGQVSPVLDHVLAFKPNGSSLILYVTTQNAPSGKVWTRIWEDGKTYPLEEIDQGNHYLIDMAQYQSDWYYVTGSDTTPRINIYKNPLDGLKNTAVGKALPMVALKQSGADKLSFSTNTRFVEAEAGQSMAVFDFETLTSYHYSLTKPLTGELHWMDGHRLIGLVGGTVFVTDFDSTNEQTLIPTASAEYIFFDGTTTAWRSLFASSRSCRRPIDRQ